MKYRYAIIPYSGAVMLGVEHIRRQTVTGEVIVNESDLLTYGEQNSFEDKIKQLGGRTLTALEARQELQKNIVDE